MPSRVTSCPFPRVRANLERPRQACTRCPTKSSSSGAWDGTQKPKPLRTAASTSSSLSPLRNAGAMTKATTKPAPNQYGGYGFRVFLVCHTVCGTCLPNGCAVPSPLEATGVAYGRGPRLAWGKGVRTSLEARERVQGRRACVRRPGMLSARHAERRQKGKPGVGALACFKEASHAVSRSGLARKSRCRDLGKARGWLAEGGLRAQD